VLDNVASIALSNLCTGCGTCSGVCPVDAIEMRILDGVFLPTISSEKCIKCRFCIRCCPVYSLDLPKLNCDIFGRQPEDVFLGNYIKCFIGNSNDNIIRFDSSSGGIITTLLIYALEKGIIDGVLLTRMRKTRPLEPEPFIAKSRAEIVSASKSKYCPVPLNQALTEILAKEGRFAVVGLPCHIIGIRKAEAIFKELKQKIVLHLGLFCGHTVNFFGTDVILSKLGVRKEDVISIDYRGKGWPGSMHIRVKDGRELVVQFYRGWNAYWNIFSPCFFTPWCCLMCEDQFNELADVSVGDAWLPGLVERGLGKSVIIVRTAVAENLFKNVENNGILSVKFISPSLVKQSQAFSLKFKKEQLSGRLSFFRLLGKRTTNIKTKHDFHHFLDIIGAFLPYVSYVLSSKRCFRSWLKWVPLPLFRLYFGLFRVLFYLS